ncbi:cation:dicarboxylase symporter family transporter, partial [Oscillatoria amoena NRMC-F 0135]|nr:cation:dicarboxylase symporter family transporter [Oscillatoria amoena NRMC-F 0135]
AQVFSKGWIVVVLLLALPLVGSQLITGLSTMLKTRIAARLMLRGIGAHLMLLGLGAAGSVTFAHLLTRWVNFDLPVATDGQFATDAGSVTAITWLATVQDVLMQLIIPTILLTVAIGVVMSAASENFAGRVMKPVARFSAKLFYLLRIVFVALPVSAGSIAFLIARQSGTQLAGFAGIYVAGVCVVLILMTLVMYGFVHLFGGIPVGRFARYMLPTQFTAAGTCSSLATLPSLLISTGKFHSKVAISEMTVPLFVSFFRLNLLVANPFSFIVLSAAYNLPVEWPNLLTFIGLMVITSFGSPGLPQMGKVYSMPVFLAAGIPLEGVLILKALDGIPDIFKTVLNVTEIGTLTSFISTGTRPAPSNQEIVLEKLS